MVLKWVLVKLFDCPDMVLKRVLVKLYNCIRTRVFFYKTVVESSKIIFGIKIKKFGGRQTKVQTL